MIRTAKMSVGATYAAGTYDDSNWMFITIRSDDATNTSPLAYRNTEFSNTVPQAVDFGYGTNVQMALWSVSYALGADPDPQYQFACDFIPASQYNGSARTTICSPVVILETTGPAPATYVPERLQWFDTLLAGTGNTEFAFGITKGGKVPGKDAGLTNFFSGVTTFTFALRVVA